MASALGLFSITFLLYQEACDFIERRMMNISQYAAAIVAAFASILTMFGIIVVRGTKITEFRQKWIDEQRQDISILIANTSQLASDPTSKRSEYLLAAELAANRIRLRENPERPEWTSVLTKIDELLNKLKSPPPKIVVISLEVEEIIRTSRINLKSEWERVRKGERGYRFYYRSILILFFLVGTICILSAVQYFGYDVPYIPRIIN